MAGTAVTVWALLVANDWSPEYLSLAVQLGSEVSGSRVDLWSLLHFPLDHPGLHSSHGFHCSGIVLIA